MSDIKISDELFEFVESNPHVQIVHFTADGKHHVNAYTRDADGKLYSKIGESAHVGQDHEGQHAPFEIVASLTRNEVLGIEEDEAAEEAIEESGSEESEAAAEATEADEKKDAEAAEGASAEDETGDNVAAD